MAIDLIDRHRPMELAAHRGRKLLACGEAWAGVLDREFTRQRHSGTAGGEFKMVSSTSYCSPDEVVSNAKCLLGRVEEVRRVLRRRGFSEHCIEYAITAVFRAALPYITGTKMCLIENRRAWVFKVAIVAAKRAAIREVRCQTLQTAILTATEKDSGMREEAFDICEVMGQLTERQSNANECDESRSEHIPDLGIAKCDDAARWTA